MNQYLNYIFQQYTIKSTSKQFNHLIKQQLLSLKQIYLTKLYKQLTNSQPLFNQLNLLLAKGTIKYSPANCTIQLSLANLLIYQRLYKLNYFANHYLQQNVALFVSQWIQQGLQNGIGFPILFNKNKLLKAFSFNPLQQSIINNSNHQQVQIQQNRKKTKSKIKQSQQVQQKIIIQNSNQDNEYNYHKLIYEYKSKDKTFINNNNTNNNNLINNNEQQLNINKQQQVKKSTSKSTISNKNKQKHLQTIQLPKNQQQQYMLNVQQLTKLLQASKYVELLNNKLSSKQKHITLFQFLNNKQKQSIIHQLKYQLLQSFIAQLLSQDSLLVFNLIKKYPYITEKQLVKLTLLDVLSTRASLNKLIEKGLVSFYNENSRTIVYKIADISILQNKYIDLIAKSIMNIQLAAQRINQLTGINVGIQKVKNKLLELQSQTQKLDDILLIFGW